MTKKIGFILILGLCLAVLGPMYSHGKETGYPEKDIRVYIPSGPGSSMDLIMRETAVFQRNFWGFVSL